METHIHMEATKDNTTTIDAKNTVQKSLSPARLNKKIEKAQKRRRQRNSIDIPFNANEARHDNVCMWMFDGGVDINSAPDHDYSRWFDINISWVPGNYQ